MTTNPEPETPTESAPEQPAALTRSTAAEIGFGISAANWEHAYRMAKVIADSEMIPKNYRGRPADVVVAMQHGAEVGLPPMAALQSIAVINGRPGLYGDGFLAVIMSSPRYARHVEYYVTATGEQVDGLRAADLEVDDTRAVSKFWRRGVADPFVAEFSIADAKRAHLWKKEGPWSEYPARQMMWRARGFAGRNGFAAELRGMTMAAELQDLPPDASADTPHPHPVLPIRRSEKSAPDAEPVTDPREPPPTPPPAPATPPVAPTRQPGKPSKAPAKPPQTTPKGSADQVVSESMIITDTAYCEPKDDDPYWEIKACVEKPGQAPMGFTFLTRDQAVYDLAESAEGTKATFNLTWQPRKRKDNSPVKELIGLAAS